MTIDTHNVGAVRMDIFDNELLPLLKLFSRAVSNSEIMSTFSDDEVERLSTFMDCLQETALQNGI
tara:strand:- start:122 stop:316 length:195 start_codon:yes stop_codon:yes gene_type:complete